MLSFGHFSIRFDLRQLIVNGQPVVLGSRAFDVLEALVQRRERLVTKAELLDLVWPDLVVEENNLQVAVSALRKLLGPQAIATVPGRGYRFTAAPAAGEGGGSSSPAAPTQAAAPAVASPSSTWVARTTAPAYLLVADDNKVNRLLLCRTLELMGHQVASVDNGRKALEALRRERHELLLLDLEMPELDGVAVLEQLARDPELHDLPVIVTSSVEGVAQVARCIELGADDYLHKPVNPVLLKARVASSLQKRRLREQQKALFERLSAAAAAPGTAATPVPTEAQRCQATVLAVRLRDAAGSGGLGGTSGTSGTSGIAGTTATEPAPDPLEVIALLDSCHTLWRDAVASHGGVVFDGNGEGLMAVFGIGAASPVPAVEVRLVATRAALEMAEMFDVLNAERAAAGKPPLALHIGVASGEVVVGHAGPPAQASSAGRLHCVGEPVRLALALQAHAHSTALTVLVDGATQSALRGRIATEPVFGPGPAGSGGTPMAMFAAAAQPGRAGQSA